MLNSRTVLLSAVLLIALGFAARLGTEVVADPSSDLAVVIEAQEPSASQNQVPFPAYRSPLDECYDVSLRELTSCRNGTKVHIPSYRSPLDECYDVPLREVTSCRNALQALTP